MSITTPLADSDAQQPPIDGLWRGKFRAYSGHGEKMQTPTQLTAEELEERVFAPAFSSGQSSIEFQLVDEAARPLSACSYTIEFDKGEEWMATTYVHFPADDQLTPMRQYIDENRDTHFLPVDVSPPQNFTLQDVGVRMCLSDAQLQDHMSALKTLTEMLEWYGSKMKYGRKETVQELQALERERMRASMK